MSYWTYINGVVTVSPMGRTQAEMRYILETVLQHLPNVTGSERDMNVHIVQKAGHNYSSSHDEFGQITDNLTDRYGCRNRKGGWLEKQNYYILVVEGQFRDRMFDQTYREFQKWLCRLAKRVVVQDVLVQIEGYQREALIRDTGDKYYEMWELPSWSRDKEATGEPNWCEYLMWEPAKGCDYPMMLMYKYYGNEDNDAEVERRLVYREE